MGSELSVNLNPSFHFVHPLIVDLYINVLTLHILQEHLDKLGPNDIIQDIQTEVDRAASEYVILVKKVEELFKDPQVVQNQLDVFTAQRQGDA